ncbi:MAG: CPBP family intramembrane metalloprotease [Candidatus Brocadiaceae bacterium]|nr:CPBP family intramembrane metalloprotease [Candidatus Brocadiaceae bacterium]
MSERVAPDAERDEGYVEESRSLTMGIVSVLPLMLVYHWGIIQSGYGERNLAQAWLTGPLNLIGIEAAHLLNVALVLALLGVLWRSGRARPFSLLAVAGIIGESAFYATLLYKGAPALAGLLDERASRVVFAIDWPAHGPLCLALGAGVYEELVFRLLLVGGGSLLLCRVFLWSRAPSLAVMLAASSVLFAAAHHVGPLGEPLESYRFLYRTVCGLALGVVFTTRGFGVAAWTHSAYNALVLFQQAALRA